jgi:pectinesterase
MRTLPMSLMLPFFLSGFARAAGIAATQPHEPSAKITVAADGSGQFPSIQKALESIPKDNDRPVVISIKDGTYHEKLRVDASFVTLRGQSRDGTRIAFSQIYGDWQKNKDDLGRAVLNLVGSDFTLQNLTVENTAGVPNHSFAIHTETADRVIITDANIISQGGDTLALMKAQNDNPGTGGGRYYLARLNIRGAVDFVCPKGWCYMEDCTLYETRADASVWHDGSGAKDQKFVIKHCSFTGVDNFCLARHHVAAQFFFIDCTFAKNIADRAPWLVRYPATSPQNAINDKRNPWGERIYFSNCHREGGDDFPWMKDNLSTAENAPTPTQITPAWTFDNTWNPINPPPPRGGDNVLTPPPGSPDNSRPTPPPAHAP